MRKTYSPFLAIAGILPVFLAAFGLRPAAAQELRGLEEAFDAAAVVDGAIVAFLEQGPIVRSVDAGASFHQLRAATPPDTLHAIAAADRVVIAGGRNGLLLRSDFSVSPTTWVEVDSGAFLGAVRGLAHDGGGNWVAVGDAGFSAGVLRSSNAGVTWSAIASLPAHPLFAVAWNAVASEWIAVGGDGFDGAVYRSADGIAWTPVPVPAGTATLRAVAADAEGNVVAVGEQGAMILSTDAGGTFAPVGGVSVSEDLSAVVSFGTNEWVAAGADGVALAMEDGEATFLFEPDPAEPAIGTLLVLEGAVFILGRDMIPPPVFSPHGGTFADPVMVELAAEGGADIFYTTDGSLPTTASTAYTGPFEVAASLTVRAVARDPDTGIYSPVASAFFLIESAPQPVAAPVIEPESGTYVGSVTVTMSADEDVSIYYTLDGSEPTTASLLYASPVTVSESSTVRAVAWDWNAGIYSSIVSAEYTIVPNAPEIAPAPGTYIGPVTVTITADANAAVYYTLDGSPPATDSLPYEGAFVIETSATVRALAVINGLESAESSAAYTVRPFAPQILPNGGEFIGSAEVTLSAQQGASIYYTLDGSEPTTTSLLYDGAFPVTTSTTLRAAALLNGELGPTASANFVIRPAAPQISPNGGTFVGPVGVTLTAQTGATIYYTLDGSTPTTASSLYEGEFVVNEPLTVRAVASLDGELSPVTSAVFTIQPFAPGISPNGGEFVGSRQVTLTAQAGEAIYYTLDGTTPTRSSLVYTSPFTVSNSRTVRAVARAHGVYSPIAEADFTILPFAPTITPNGGDFVGPVSVSLTAQSGAAIYYTLDGTEPTTGSQLYNGAFEVTTSATLKAVAFLNGELGPVAEAEFIIRPFAPVIEPNGGEFEGAADVTLATQPGTVIYYTLDGSEPTTGSLLYTGAFTLDISATVRAIAWLDGVPGPEASAAFTIVVPDPDPRLWIERLPGNELLLTLSNPESEVIYQLQSSTDLVSWRNEGAPVTGADDELTWHMPIDGPARFFRVTTEIRTVASPEISPSGGTYGEAIEVSLSAESGAEIFYTVDGSAPSSASLLYDGTFTVDSSVTINAIALLDGLYSAVTSVTYTIEEPAPESYRLTISPLSSTEARLTLSGSDTGIWYQLQVSTNLTTWSDLQTPQAGTGDPLTWDVPYDGSPRFYRVITVEDPGEPDEPFTLSISPLSSTEARLTLSGSVAGTWYQLQVSTNLATWSDLQTPRAGTGDPLTWDVPYDGSPRFYRVITVEDPGDQVADAVHLRIDRLSATEHRVTLSGAVAGRLYQMETSADLKNWTNAGPPREASGIELVWDFPIDGSSRFYRVVSVE